MRWEVRLCAKDRELALQIVRNIVALNTIRCDFTERLLVYAQFAHCAGATARVGNIVCNCGSSNPRFRAGLLPVAIICPTRFEGDAVVDENAPCKPLESEVISNS